MREFVYYSKNAVTSGKYIGDDLKKAGRMDIVINVLIAAFFLSHDTRRDVRLHFIFDGPPTPPVHLRFDYDPDSTLSKKDVASLIKKMLYKCPQEKEKELEVFPGATVEKRSFESLIKKLEQDGKNIILLDKGGEDIRKLDIKGNEVFIIGDQDGFPNSKRRLLKRIDKISVSPRMLFASQVITLLHNEIDRTVD